MELKARDESSATDATTSTAEVLLTEEPVATRPVPIKGRRRNLGRQARKRRKKYLEIEAAFVAAAAAAGVETNRTASAVTTSTSTSTRTESTEIAGDEDSQEVLGSNATTTAIKNTVLPTDRGYVLDDVRKRTVLSEADRHDLIHQLGYLPGNALRIVARLQDAFSSDDLQRLVAAAAMVTTKMKTRTATQGESDGAKDTASSNTDGNSKLSNDSDNHSTTDTSGTTIATTNCNCNDMQANERKKKAMASMIQTMMKEPLVIKLYPLVLRDESSSTKRRRKRRREETEDDSTDRHNGASSVNKTPAADSTSAGTTGTNDGATSSAAGTVALPQTTPLMEPFPTIYWVSHPLIKALISKLELDRVNVQFEQRLLDEETERKKSEDSHPTDDATANDSNSNSNNNNNSGVTSHSSTPLASMKRAHISYGRERRGLLSSRDMEYVKGRRWYDETSPSSPPKTKTATAAPFSDGCGVAGIRNPKGVKCLHAHAAHYWSGNSDNIVGFWVWERLKSGCSFFSG
jgi:hypothetical protein